MRIKDYNKILPIIEIYPALQGEGSHRGVPSFMVRTTGCTHRCYFGTQGGWCDAWYSSIHANKGRFSFKDVVSMIDNNQYIKEIILTGGSPTMHPSIVNEITHLANKYGLFTTLETEGSHFIKTDYPINLISLSPKLSNSIPKVGINTPRKSIVTQKTIKQHNKYRLNIKAMKQMLDYHLDYQLKPVCDGSFDNLQEIKEIIKNLNIPKNKVYLMPAGNTRKSMIDLYSKITNIALDNGFNFTGRDHIIAFDNQTGV